MLADLDRFKAVNDQFGHAIGDRVLQIFADTITRTLRATDMSGRLGGEEFAFLMPGTNAAEAERIAERIRVQFADAARKVGGLAVNATVSVGIATAVAPAQLADLIAVADGALYRAKAEGRNRVAVIDCGAAPRARANRRRRVVVPIRGRATRPEAASEFVNSWASAQPAGAMETAYLP